jgi:hypothetical protein
MKKTRTVHKIRRCNNAVETAPRLDDQELGCDFSRGKEIFSSQHFQTVCAALHYSYSMDTAALSPPVEKTRFGS